MMLLIAGAGVFTLVMIAVMIGYLDRRAQHDAWRKIAAERRRLGEPRSDLDA